MGGVTSVEEETAPVVETERSLSSGSVYPGSVGNILFQSFRCCIHGLVGEDAMFKGRHFVLSVILLCVR
jgi:hypothetical protein